jgi:hypothetical protein
MELNARLLKYGFPQPCSAVWRSARSELVAVGLGKHAGERHPLLAHGGGVVNHLADRHQGYAEGVELLDLVELEQHVAGQIEAR